MSASRTGASGVKPRFGPEISISRSRTSSRDFSPMVPSKAGTTAKSSSSSSTISVSRPL